MITMPLYANRPKRRISGTEVTAVTMLQSKDRSVREYSLFDAAGNHIGQVAYHGAMIGVSAGYHEGHGSYHHAKRSFPNLAAAAKFYLANAN